MKPVVEMATFSFSSYSRVAEASQEAETLSITVQMQTQRYYLDLPTQLYVAASPFANRLISSLPNVPSFPGCPFPGHPSTPPLAPFSATSIIPFARSVDEIADEGKIVARALMAPKRSGWRYKKDPSETGCEGRMVIGRKMKGAREEEEGEEEGKAARRRSALPVNVEGVSMEVDKEHFTAMLATKASNLTRSTKEGGA
jgi:hypothetical protein